MTRALVCLLAATSGMCIAAAVLSLQQHEWGEALARGALAWLGYSTALRALHAWKDGY